MKITKIKSRWLANGCLTKNQNIFFKIIIILCFEILLLFKIMKMKFLFLNLIQNQIILSGLIDFTQKKINKKIINIDFQKF